ncbi:MAG TPA: hypothetical protein VGN63_21995 [Flavisolibacter sp.]|jgi:hypothetical protein|nr:hypothetical protein [Flavisolibacter sp.]
MRKLWFFLCILFSQTVLSQGSRIDFARLENAPDRVTITETYWNHLKTTFGILPVLTLDNLYIKNGFAFLIGKIRDNGGKEIDFANFDPVKRKNFLAFKGQETRALLKRKGENWEVLVWLVTSDDAACACWWAEYNAPKELFDYTDYCR